MAKRPVKKSRPVVTFDSTTGLLPEERAEVVVTRLERFIKDHRTLSRGVSFRKWQDMAKNEIADLLREQAQEQVREHRYVEKTLMVLGASLATIGVWGTALAIEMAPNRVFAGVATLFAGLVVLWCVGALGMRTPFRRTQTDTARQTLERVRSVNRKVSDLEHHLKRRKKALEQEQEALPEE